MCDKERKEESSAFPLLFKREKDVDGEEKGKRKMKEEEEWKKEQQNKTKKRRKSFACEDAVSCFASYLGNCLSYLPGVYAYMPREEGDS